MIQLYGHAHREISEPSSRLRACRSSRARTSSGPTDGTLSVRTSRTGAAAKAGHDLLIHVTAWHATLDVGEDPAESSLALDVDATVAARARGHRRHADARGRRQGEHSRDDRRRRPEAASRSSFARPRCEPTADGAGRVQGELTLVGKTAPLAFDLTIGDDGTLSGSAVVKQSDWGIKPYSALFGALKVADEVERRATRRRQPAPRALTVGCRPSARPGRLRLPGGRAPVPWA